MIKFYIWSIILFIISVFLFAFRYIVLKSKINLNDSNSNKLQMLYNLLRIIVAGTLPLINIVFTLIYLYYGIFVSDDVFIKLCSDKIK